MLSITRFVVITLLVFSGVIKLHNFDVIRLHDSDDYDYKVQD